jgi:hypothetical protein
MPNIISDRLLSLKQYSENPNHDVFFPKGQVSKTPIGNLNIIILGLLPEDKVVIYDNRFT